MNMNDKYRFEKIDAARKLLDLEETATIVQIWVIRRNWTPNPEVSGQ